MAPVLSYIQLNMYDESKTHGNKTNKNHPFKSRFIMVSVLKNPTRKNIPIKEQILASQRKLIVQFLFNINL